MKKQSKYLEKLEIKWIQCSNIKTNQTATKKKGGILLVMEQ